MRQVWWQVGKLNVVCPTRIHKLGRNMAAMAVKKQDLDLTLSYCSFWDKYRL